MATPIPVSQRPPLTFTYEIEILKDGNFDLFDGGMGKIPCDISDAKAEIWVVSVRNDGCRFLEQKCITLQEAEKVKDRLNN